MLKNHKILAAILFGIAAFLISACGGTSTPTLSPTPAEPTSRLATSAFVERPTLPATWTETATPTITITPSPTDTPTLTLSPTVTATRTADEICEIFKASIVVFPGSEYNLTDRIDYFTAYDDTAGEIEFVAENHTTGEDYHLVLPGGNIYTGKLALSIFPGAGDYTLTIQLNMPGRRALCSSSVTFTIRPRSPLDVLIDALTTLNAPHTPTITPTPDFQATLDAEITSEANNAG